MGIARALTVQPGILLLGEPLGALDAMTRLTMQEELARILSGENVTMILVTRDLEEAIFLADRVLVLSADGTAPALSPVDRPARAAAAGPISRMRRMLMGRFAVQQTGRWQFMRLNGRNRETHAFPRPCATAPQKTVLSRDHTRPVRPKGAGAGRAFEARRLG